MLFMTLKLSVSGARGIVGKSFTPDLCRSMATAFMAYTGGRNAVVGTDTRPSRGILKQAVFEGLRQSGCTALDAGIVPTPTVSVLVREMKADAGIVISASHNPPEWNGLKFFNSKGLFLNTVEADKLFRIWKEGRFPKNAPGGVPRVLEHPFTSHLDSVFGSVDVKRIGKMNFKVALDCVNGAGSKIIPRLLADLNCRVVAINTNVDLGFPHNPEPLPENLGDLSELVKREGADVGFAVDPDSDRLAIVSNDGLPVGEENTLALSVQHVLKNRKATGPVVTNLSTTRAIDDIALRFNTRVIRTRIGEINVAEEMIRSGSPIGGEGNGGVIFPPVGHNRDSLIGIALTLEHMAFSGMPVAKLMDEVPRYHMIKRKIGCESNEKAKMLVDRIKVRFRNGRLDETDGAKISFENSWIHVRASNTEPVIRLIAEAGVEGEARKLLDEASKAMSG